MTKKFLIIFLTTFNMFALQAQRTMRDVWLSMPNQQFPYLTEKMRINMLENVENNSKESTTDMFGGSCKLEKITDSYLCGLMGKSTKLEMKIFQSDKGDTLLCVVKTLMSDVSESKVQICSIDWSQIKELSPKRDVSLFVVDTLSGDSREKVDKLLSPLMVTVKLSEDTSIAVEEVSLPFMSKEEKTWLKPLLVVRQRRLSEL